MVHHNLREATALTERMDAIRAQFPVLNRKVKSKPLVYFDNAATAQKPITVIQELTRYYEQYNANIHRGIHTLAEEATEAFEATRDAIKDFIHAGAREEIIFTHGTTEAINLVARTWGREHIQEGDEILISAVEHHANIVPWQIVCEEKNANLKIIPVLENGALDIEALPTLLSTRTKLVAVSQASNALGTINPVAQIIEMAHEVGAVVLIDGAQSVVHLDIDVQALNCDFFVFSAHKLYGPTGVGVLYGKQEILESMPVFLGGGEMIKEVSFEKTTYNELPYKFEAGTPNIANVIAFKHALTFVHDLGRDAIRQHEHCLLAYATDLLSQIPSLRILGNTPEKLSLISFVIDNIHPQDLGILLDNQGIAVRTGHHCAQPLMHRYNISGTVRASFALYNTYDEIDVFVEGLKKAVRMLS